MAKTKRRKPGDWNKRQRNRFKAELYEWQQGACLNCYCKFPIDRLRFKWNSTSETYSLFCAGCHG